MPPTVGISPIAIVTTRPPRRAALRVLAGSLAVPDPAPPAAPRRPTTLTHFDDVRVDDYFWLRDRDDPAVLAYLDRGERATPQARSRATASLESRRSTTRSSRGSRRPTSPRRSAGAPWWYYERTFEGRNYPVHCRRPRTRRRVPDRARRTRRAGAARRERARRGARLLLGRRPRGRTRPPPRARSASTSRATSGTRVSFLSLDGATAPPESIDDVGYAVAWTADARVAALRARRRRLAAVRAVAPRPRGPTRPTTCSSTARTTSGSGSSVSRSRDDAALLVHVGSAHDDRGPRRSTRRRRSRSRCCGRGATASSARSST